MTAEEFIAMLASEKADRDAASAKAEANRAAREERAEAKVIAAYEKEMARIRRREDEQLVRETLIESRFWTNPKDGFVTLKDMADFIKGNVAFLRQVEGYKSQFKKGEALDFLKRAMVVSDHEWVCRE